MQKARRRVSAPTACGHTGSGTISTPSRGAFHRSLAVLCAIGLPGVFSLAGWAPLVPTGLLVSCRTQARRNAPTRRSGTGMSPSASAAFQPHSRPTPGAPCAPPYYPGAASTAPVWAPPRSLATTGGIDLSFSSCRYWDVSVPCVRPHRCVRASRRAGCPIRTPPDLVPFADPRGVSPLTASFIASGSQGVHRVPLSRSFAHAAHSARRRTEPRSSPIDLSCLGVVSRFVFSMFFTSIASLTAFQ